MSIKELMIDFHGEEPDMAAEYYIDTLINAPWFAAKDLCDNVSKIPHERIVEAITEIDDAIRLLALAKIELEEKKQ